MVWQPGKSGNPGGRPKEKPIRDALRMELAAAELGDAAIPKPGTVRAIARAIIQRAQSGDVPAFKEIADRLEGKVPQGIIGGDEGDNPINLITRIERVIVNAANPDSPGLPPAPPAGPV
jgi:hypothetical protein